MKLLAIVIGPKSVARYLRGLGEPTDVPQRTVVMALGPAFVRAVGHELGPGCPPKGRQGQGSARAATGTLTRHPQGEGHEGLPGLERQFDVSRFSPATQSSWAGTSPSRVRRAVHFPP